MSKADAIRAYHREHPDATYAQIITALGERGVKVSNPHIAYALGRSQKGTSTKRVRGDWFTRWYKADTRRDGQGLYWYVVRVDKPEKKGTRIGPVKFKGRSYYQDALAEAERRNREILAKRRELRAAGLGPPELTPEEVAARSTEENTHE